MSGEKTQYSCDEILQKLRKEIIPLFNRAICDDTVSFHNPKLVVCKARKNCNKPDCPSFTEEAQRCWQVAGTFCGGKVQGALAEKYEDCRKCDVFRASCPTIVEEMGENLNNMLFLLRKRKEELAKKSARIEYLNRELLSSLENLDAKNVEIQTLMMTDKLTGLFNRHCLMTSLEDEIMRCSRRKYTFSVLMLDIDDFKRINDTYGHLSGDAVLSKLGAMLKGAVRNYDRGFRYGGEEFVVLLPDTEQTMTWIIAERLRKGFEQEEYEFKRTGQEVEEKVSCTMSIGCASYSPELTVDDILRRADEALYAAKGSGKNAVVRYDDL